MLRNSLVLFICSLLFLTGCAVGPDYERPETVAQTADKFVNQPESCEVECSVDLSRWWEGFADETTVNLVEKGLESNQDLHIAAARVIQSQGRYKFATGAKLPQVNYSFDRVRSKASIDLPGGLANFLTTTYTHQISASYVLDVFGKLERQDRAAWDELLSSSYARESVMQAVVAGVVIARTNIGNINRQLEIARENTNSWEKTYRTIERRYKSGLSTALDLRLARENLAATRASELEFEELLHEEEYRLDVLLGVQPGSTGSLPALKAELPKLEDVPCGLPASLLDRRADLKAAEMRLAASTEQIGVNVASLYPDLTLTGSTGFRSSDFDKLLNSDYEIYSLIFNALQPIFRGGQLKAQVEISEAVAEEAAAEYASSVLEAMREVESALMRERVLREKLTALEKRVEEAIASEELARDRYFRGLEKLVTVLDAERRKRAAELERSIALASIWRTRVDLYLALGGDWGVEGYSVSCELDSES